MSEDSNWVEWSNYVLKGMEELKNGQQRLSNEVSSLREEVVKGDALQDREWVKQSRVLDQKVTKTAEQVATNKESISNHKWFLRAIMGVTIIASLGGIFGTVNSCQSTESPERIERIDPH